MVICRSTYSLTAVASLDMSFESSATAGDSAAAAQEDLPMTRLHRMRRMGIAMPARIVTAAMAAGAAMAVALAAPQAAAEAAEANSRILHELAPKGKTLCFLIIQFLFYRTKKLFISNCRHTKSQMYVEIFFNFLRH